MRRGSQMRRWVIAIGAVGVVAMFSALAFADSGARRSGPTAPRPGLRYAYPGDQKPTGAQVPDASKSGRSAPEPAAQTPLTLAEMKRQAAANGENVTITKNLDGTFSAAIGIPAPPGTPVVPPPSGHYDKSPDAAPTAP